MNILIICGSPWCATDALFSILQNAGVSLGKPVINSALPTLDCWHERLCAGYANLTPIINPGKAWELSASELFWNNLDKPIWGWANNKSTWLLEFWRTFTPHIRFIFSYSSLETALVTAMCSEALFDRDKVISTWVKANTEMLRFFYRYPEQCLIIDSDQALSHPDAFISTLSRELALPLEKPTALQETSEKNSTALFYLIAEKILQTLETDELAALDVEIKSCLTDCLQGITSKTPQFDTEVFFSRNINIEQALALLQQLLQSQKKLTELEAALQSLSHSFEQHNDQLETQKQLFEQQQQALKNEQKISLEQQTQFNLIRNAYQQQESQLIALQQQLDNSTKEKNELTTALNRQKQLVNERQAALDAELQRLAESHRYHNLLLETFCQLQEEQEYYFSQYLHFKENKQTAIQIESLLTFSDALLTLVSQKDEELKKSQQANNELLDLLSYSKLIASQNQYDDALVNKLQSQIQQLEIERDEALAAEEAAKKAIQSEMELLERVEAHRQRIHELNEDKARLLAEYYQQRITLKKLQKTCTTLESQQIARPDT